ncbi:MAG: ADP-ribosylglycohydrolase family protein [Cyanobacteriota bacterium]|nr:ADP-ribosylglycohydrolase family protein [Cyanobacteriota bacterium]
MSRFQGGLLGTQIAQQQSGQGNPFPPTGQKQPLPSRDRDIPLLCAAESLIQCGRLDLAHWCEQLRLEQPSALDLKQRASASHTALWILPIALYFHDHRQSLHDNVRQAAALWLHPQENADDLFLWADAIAWILRENLTGPDLLDRLLETAEGRWTPTCQHLKELRTLCDRAVPLEAVLDRFSTSRFSTSPIPLALAFYFFASTPEDFCLCIKRAARGQNTPSIALALTGALAGLYNSAYGLPPRWRAHPQVDRAKQQGERLFATWSGVYQSHRRTEGVRAVAAAGAIQPRASLKIISHHSC